MGIVKAPPPLLQQPKYFCQIPLKTFENIHLTYA